AAFAGDNQEHRLWLYRQWVSGGRGTVPYALFCGMNPSTARADVNDPTSTREVGFTQSWGFGAYYKGNAGSHRATAQKAFRAAEGPSHPANPPPILRLARGAAKVIICHGVLGKPVRHLGDQTVIALRGAGIPLFCFGKTLLGHPRHPLYL